MEINAVGEPRVEAADLARSGRAGKGGRAGGRSAAALERRGPGNYNAASSV